MQYYGYKGRLGRIKCKTNFLRSWILHTIAYSTPHPGLTIKMQRARGVNIGKSCYIGPYVLIDLIYPNLVRIADSVTIGSNTLIFAHTNPTASLFFKKGDYPRKVEPVTIKSGAWIAAGCIITAGVTVGENSIVSVGSVVTENVPEYCIVMGNPARVVKRINK